MFPDGFDYDSIFSYDISRFDFQRWMGPRSMKILFLDDSPERHRVMRTQTSQATCDHAYTANDALKMLKKHNYDLIMLDHDLNEDPECKLICADGTYVAEYMSKFMPQHIETPVVVHSLNTVAASRMRKILEDDGGYMFVHTIPFAWEKILIREDGQAVFRK
jgi:CheY-like chemotaxis protein